MNLLQIQWNPTDRQLRQFGLISLFALPLVAWFWAASLTTIGIFAVIGGLLAVSAWAYPPSVKFLFLGLMILALPIGLVVSELALLIIYYFVFLPIGLLFKIVGRDKLQLRVDRNKKSYWQKKELPETAASYFRQF